MDDDLGVRPLIVAVFTVDELRFGLPIERLDGIVRAAAVTPLPGAPSNVLGVVNVHGTVRPVLNMRRKFLQRHRDVCPGDHFVLAHTTLGSPVLLVDRPEGVIEECRPAALPPYVGSRDQFSGVLTLDDGLVLVHDLDAFLSYDEARTLAEAMDRHRPASDSAS